MRLLILVLLLSWPAQAQQLWLGDQPFPGVVQQDKVELRPLMESLGLHGHRVYGGWCLNSRAAVEADCPVKQLAGPGRVFLDGQPIAASTDGEGRTLVSLPQLAHALRLPLTQSNDTMRLSVIPGVTEPPREPNVRKPGAEVNLKHVPGRTNLIVFYLDWCPACWKVLPALEDLARKHPELAITEVNVSDWDEPVARQHNVRSTPSVYILDENGQVLANERTSLDWLEQRYPWKAPTRLRCTGVPSAR